MINVYSSISRIILLLTTVMLLSSCENHSHEDVYAFIDDAKRQPPAIVPPVKRYPPYKPHTYSAHQLRSPFIPPYVIEKKILEATSDVKPDFDRQKQRLEGFELSSLSMVGTIEKAGTLWALIRDPEGAIERVKVGYYLGKKHGKVTDVSHQVIDLIEIVSNGDQGWSERPNIISIKER